MSDWIKKLKEKDDQAASEAETESQLQLHRAKIVAALAPAFWATLLDAIEESCTELHKAFPNDPMRHCTLSRQASYCELRGHGKSEYTLRITLNVAGMVLDEELFSVTAGRQKHRSNVAFKVSGQDKLYLMRGTTQFTTAESLAEDVVRRVCEIYG